MPDKEQSPSVTELSPIERLAEHLAARVKPDTTEEVADWLDYSLNRCGLLVVEEHRLAHPTPLPSQHDALAETLRDIASRAHAALAKARGQS